MEPSTKGAKITPDGLLSIFKVAVSREIHIVLGSIKDTLIHYAGKNTKKMNKILLILESRSSRIWPLLNSHSYFPKASMTIVNDGHLEKSSKR